MVSEWTARTTTDGVTREWDGIDVFPIVERQDHAQGCLLVLARRAHVQT